MEDEENELLALPKGTAIPLGEPEVFEKEEDAELLDGEDTMAVSPSRSLAAGVLALALPPLPLGLLLPITPPRDVMREKPLLLPLLFCEFDIMWHKNSVVLGFDFDFLYSRQLLRGVSSS